MKKYSLLILFLAILNIAAAQTITATGNVKGANSYPLHYAFVQDKQFKNGTYTDSLGNFTLEIRPNSTLSISCAGYKDTVVQVGNKNTLSVILRPAVNVAANSTANAVSNNNAIIQSALRDQMDLNQPRLQTIIQQGTILPMIHTREATQGSKYLFKDWVHGYVINGEDYLIQSPGFLLNYDKISGNLILTQDKVSAIAVDRDKAKSFTLFDAFNQPYTFAIVPGIDKTHYVQVIAAGNNYNIFKLIKTKFIASNYSSDGLASTGNNYDEYADEDTYYVIGKSGNPQKISLKKKSLKEAFNQDQGKLDQYFKTNDGDIDDNYLKDLGGYMNK